MAELYWKCKETPLEQYLSDVRLKPELDAIHEAAKINVYSWSQDEPGTRLSW
jgi:hypothetical protein